MPLRLSARVALACLALVGSAVALPVPASARVGVASTYGYEIYGINPSGKTANGEIFKPAGLTAAMWGVPFNSRWRVTSLKTGRSVVVRINDRGPHRRLRRLIDLSTGSAAAMGMKGLERVRVEPAGKRHR